MTKTLLLLSFCFIYISTFGQYSYYKKALIVKKDSSTYSGYVEKISESELNPVLKFKQNIDDDNSILFHVDDVQQLVFTADSLTFENVNYTWRKDSIKITEQRLAKKMIEGYACLYKLQLHPEEISIIFEVNNTFVYVVKIDTNYYTLYQKERLEDSSSQKGVSFFAYPTNPVGGIFYYPEYSSYKLIKGYQGVLYYILRDYKDLSEQVKDLNFSDNQIIPLISKLNGYHSEVKSFTVKIKKEKPWISHGPVISALGIDRFDGEFVGANVGYQLKIVYPNLNEKVSTDFGVFFDRWYESDFGKKPYNDFIRFYFGGTYRFNNNAISPFMGVGVAYHAYLKNPYEVMASGTLGVIFYKRTIVSATIEGMPGSILPEIAPPTHLFFNLGFLFGKN